MQSFLSLYILNEKPIANQTNQTSLAINSLMKSKQYKLSSIGNVLNKYVPVVKIFLL